MYLYGSGGDGLYFMGAIVLFEKASGCWTAIAVSPVKTYEFMLSKLLSIGAISVIVGFSIGFFSHAVNMTDRFLWAYSCAPPVFPP